MKERNISHQYRMQGIEEKIWLSQAIEHISSINPCVGEALILDFLQRVILSSRETHKFPLSKNDLINIGRIWLSIRPAANIERLLLPFRGSIVFLTSPTAPIDLKDWEEELR